MSREVAFRIDGQSVPKQSFRFRRGGRSFIPAKVKAWEELVGWQAKQAMKGGELLEGPLKVSIDFYVAKRPGRPADLGNLEKPICDAMNGVVYKDDSQIFTMHLSRMWTEIPHVLVVVKEQ